MEKFKENATIEPAPVDISGHENIEVFGAREHNLKNIDVTIPRNKLVVITGISGSGKSSLAFDTIYAEGRTQVYGKAFGPMLVHSLAIVERPDVRQING